MTAATVQPDKNALERAVLAENDRGGEDDASELLARGWAALPASYRIPEVAPTLDRPAPSAAPGRERTTRTSTWPRGSCPRRSGRTFIPSTPTAASPTIWATRWARRRQALALLDLWGRELDACYEGRARHPVFVALAETIRACSIPKEPFADLLVAFRQDQTVTRYATMDDVLGYCRYSANPVGRLVLYACGEAPGEH